MTADLYLDGAWTSSTGTERVTVLNPATEEPVGDVPAGTSEDVDRAVRAARRAFEGWAETGPGERAKLVARLAGAVWPADDERAQRVARRLRATQIEVNGGKFNGAAPFGGYKQSGLGREGGAFGIEEFVEVKSLQL